MKKLFVLIMAVCLLGGAGVVDAQYADNGDGTVTDNRTNLMWQQVTAPAIYTWQNAIAYCNNLVLAGHSDWRLPNLNELESLVNRDHTPAIDPVYFPNTEYEIGYWSSTSDNDNMNKAWSIAFSYGYEYTYEKTVNMHVRAVRTRQSDEGAIADQIFKAAEQQYPGWFFPTGRPVEMYNGFQYPMYYRYYLPKHITLLTYNGVVYYLYNGQYTSWGTVNEWLSR